MVDYRKVCAKVLRAVTILVANSSYCIASIFHEPCRPCEQVASLWLTLSLCSASAKFVHQLIEFGRPIGVLEARVVLRDPSHKPQASSGMHTALTGGSVTSIISLAHLSRCQSVVAGRPSSIQGQPTQQESTIQLLDRHAWQAPVRVVLLCLSSLSCTLTYGQSAGTQTVLWQSQGSCSSLAGGAGGWDSHWPHRSSFIHWPAGEPISAFWAAWVSVPSKHPCDSLRGWASAHTA